MKYILDEEKWAEDTIASATIDGSHMETLARLARYYYEKGYKTNEIREELNKFLMRSDKYADVSGWKDAVARCVRQAGRYRLLVADGVDITKSEIEKIDLLKGVLKKKVMFTMLCVAKYYNLRNPEMNNNWVNTKMKEIFGMADVQITMRRQCMLVNDLITDGYLKPSVAVDNTNMNVQIVDDDSEVVLTVTSFRDLGNQYLMYKGARYVVCAECGAVVKKNSNNQKYCRKCSENHGKPNQKDKIHYIQELEKDA